jgi:hypothetical protein
MGAKSCGHESDAAAAARATRAGTVEVPTVMLSKNAQPGLARLDRALLKGIPTFAALKTDGATVEEITTAFKGWDSAVDAKLMAAALQTLVTNPVIEIVRPANADMTLTRIHGVTGESPGGQRKLITARECHRDRFQGKISLRQVYALFYSGDLEGFRVGRSVLLYDDSVDVYIRRNRNADHPSNKGELENPTVAQATIQRQRPRSSQQGGFQFFHLPEGR